MSNINDDSHHQNKKHDLEIKHSWNVSQLKVKEKTWVSSDYFMASTSDKIAFSLHAMYLENERHTVICVKILKQGIITPKLATMKIYIDGLREKKSTIRYWKNTFSKIFKFNHQKYHGSINCIIRLDGTKLENKNFVASDWITNMSNYLFSTELSDLTIKTGDDILPAHKIVLASQSPVFDRMFQSNMKEANESTVNLNEFDTDIIKQVLRFMYTCKIQQDNDIDVLLELSACANMYQITNLKTFCEHQLILNFDVDNIVEILVETDHLDMQLLNEKASIYIDINKPRLSMSTVMKEIGRSKVLQSIFGSETELGTD